MSEKATEFMKHGSVGFIVYRSDPAPVCVFVREGKKQFHQAFGCWEGMAEVRVDSFKFERNIADDGIEQFMGLFASNADDTTS